MFAGNFFCAAHRPFAQEYNQNIRIRTPNKSLDSDDEGKLRWPSLSIQLSGRRFYSFEAIAGKFAQYRASLVWRGGERPSNKTVDIA